MNLGIKELWDIGFFHFLLNWTNGYISMVIWVCVLIGAGIQYLLIKKCKSKTARLSLVIIAALAALACEFICQVVTGWNLFGWLIIYGLVIAILLGSIIVWVICFGRYKRKTEN